MVTSASAHRLLERLGIRPSGTYQPTVQESVLATLVTFDPFGRSIHVVDRHAAYSGLRQPGQLPPRVS